nr:thioredoxin family protein [uncultured Duganella sp.]
MSDLKPTTDTTFAVDVLQSAKPVIVDFTADWCGPCKSLKPILRDLANEYADEVEFLAVDADTNPELCKQYQVRSLPTLFFFQDGEMRERMHPGRRSDMSQQIERLLGAGA